jgi:hypothetical protein
MKSKRNVITALVIVLTFAVGYLTGLLVEYPKIGRENVSGTIGRVSNYRNIKTTEADIELKNDLVTDKDFQKAMRAYMSFNYSKSIEFAQTIAFAIEQAKAVPALTVLPEMQESLVKYVQFLEESRKDLLQAVIACQFVDELSPVELRNTMDQANNIIARMNQANALIVELIDQLDEFILKNGSSAYPELNRAHDLLVYNQLGSSIINKDKSLIQYFSKKNLYAKDVQSKPVDVKTVINGDMEKLNGMTFFDFEKLGMWDNEKLSGSWDKEKLGAVEMDVEVLGGFFDSEKLGAVYFDSEKLGAFNDSEKLGAIGAFDAEKLGGITVLDAEKLGGIFALDAEKLGFMDNEKLGTLW